MDDAWWAYIACAPIPCDTATRVSMEGALERAWGILRCRSHVTSTVVGSTVAYGMYSHFVGTIYPETER
eukprot:scaffold43301_cov57-Phaeocystis_antarctica.AAC.4